MVLDFILIVMTIFKSKILWPINLNILNIDSKYGNKSYLNHFTWIWDSYTNNNKCIVL